MAIAGAALLPGKETDAPGEPEYAPVAALPALPGRRLASIDALRGFDMFWLMQEESGLVLALAAALHLPFPGSAGQAARSHALGRHHLLGPDCAALPVYRRAKSAFRYSEPSAPR